MVQAIRQLMTPRQGEMTVKCRDSLLAKWPGSSSISHQGHRRLERLLDFGVVHKDPFRCRLFIQLSRSGPGHFQPTSQLGASRWVSL
eukprot:s634_g16.t1